jgi:hypothetical protein
LLAGKINQNIRLPSIKFFSEKNNPTPSLNENLFLDENNNSYGLKRSLVKVTQNPTADLQYFKSFTPTQAFLISTPKVQPTITQVLVFFTPTPTDTAIVNNPTFTPVPTVVFTPTPTPTPRPTSTPTPRPYNCPSSSNESYRTIVPTREPDNMPISGDPVESAELNLRHRGFGLVNESPVLISREGNTYGLDNLMPPQISTLFNGPIPTIVKTYIVYAWDFRNKKSLAPQSATPNFKVHLIGLNANPGQRLYGLRAGRKINSNGDVFMVLYASQKDITFTHSASDPLMGGYLFYFIDICVDPNLLRKYQESQASGRRTLPVVSPGQVFGYASNTDIKVAVRDTMSFMDPRYKEDWWFYSR